MGYLDIRQLDETVTVLRYFEENEMANHLIDEYIQARIDAASLTKVRFRALNFRVEDSYINQKLHALVQNAQEERSLGGVVQTLSLKEGYNLEDIEFLASFSEDDFYDYFKSVNSPDLYFQVKSGLRFAEGKDEPYKMLGAKVKQAMIKIASENRINRLRIRNLFKIDEEAEQIQNTEVA